MIFFMKSIKFFIFLIVLSLLLVLCGCAHAQIENKENSFLHIFDFSENAIKVKGIQAGDSIDDVLQILALTREDCEIFESKAVSGNIIVDPAKETYYDEFGTHEVDAVYTFSDDALKQISYNIAFWDIDFDSACKIGSSVFQKIENAIPFNGKLNCEGFTLDENTKSLDLLNEFAAGIPGTRVVKTWETDGVLLYLDIVYQDRSDATYRPENVVCMQLNISYQT